MITLPLWITVALWTMYSIWSAHTVLCLGLYCAIPGAKYSMLGKFSLFAWIPVTIFLVSYLVFA